MEVNELVNSIKDIEFFKSKRDILKIAELRELVNSFQFEEFEAGSDIFHEGDFGDKFYLILKGKCKV